MRDRVVLKTVSVSLPFGIGSMSWNTDPTERKAAWSLYVELVTRIAVQPLSVDQGLVREALNSLYSLFGITREVLKGFLGIGLVTMTLILIHPLQFTPPRREV